MEVSLALGEHNVQVCLLCHCADAFSGAQAVIFPSKCKHWHANISLNHRKHGHEYDFAQLQKGLSELPVLRLVHLL